MGVGDSGTLHHTCFVLLYLKELPPPEKTIA
jgi:hypothetical protein